MLKDLYPAQPYNLGWPVFEGSYRKVSTELGEFMESSLKFRDTLAPIYEYRHFIGTSGCAIGGYYLDHLAGYLFADNYGTIRFLRESTSGKWNEVFSRKLDTDIWSLGYDKKRRKVFLSSSRNTFELLIPVDKFESLYSAILCRTTIPGGEINNLGCG